MLHGAGRPSTRLLNFYTTPAAMPSTPPLLDYTVSTWTAPYPTKSTTLSLVGPLFPFPPCPLSFVPNWLAGIWRVHSTAMETLLPRNPG